MSTQTNIKRNECEKFSCKWCSWPQGNKSKLKRVKSKKALHRHFKSHLSFTINMNESKFNMNQHGTLFVSGFTALKIKTRDTVTPPARTCRHPSPLRLQRWSGLKHERETIWKIWLRRGEIKIKTCKLAIARQFWHRYYYDKLRFCTVWGHTK